MYIITSTVAWLPERRYTDSNQLQIYVLVYMQTWYPSVYVPTCPLFGGSTVVQGWVLHTQFHRDGTSTYLVCVKFLFGTYACKIWFGTYYCSHFTCCLVYESTLLCNFMSVGVLQTGQRVCGWSGHRDRKYSTPHCQPTWTLG